MRPATPASVETPEPDPVVVWRTTRLREAGFSSELAEALARDCSYDLHAILRLVDRGCPAELAARILAPIEREARPC
ncbi:MAG TPA: hypothetical protein VEX67_02555 [Solirubrobacteraceae bacterium]|nr:hypothetical protein [Solirubrobacteraceae bacterium]